MESYSYFVYLIPSAYEELGLSRAQLFLSPEFIYLLQETNPCLLHFLIPTKTKNRKKSVKEPIFLVEDSLTDNL